MAAKKATKRTAKATKRTAKATKRTAKAHTDTVFSDADLAGVNAMLEGYKDFANALMAPTMEALHRYVASQERIAVALEGICKSLEATVQMGRG